ncbi:MAG: hypothetical protein MUE37_04645 [Bacteroidales bacterium]|jgi:putative Mn2+ efflux pump MntP|nr:hypothetical protein [Bacteroidales bacterium]
MKKLEKVLIAGAIIGFLLAVFKVPYHSVIASVFLLPLGVIYLYLGFALFNDIPFNKIFKSESYLGIGTWRIAIAIGTGLGLSQLTTGFMFAVNDFPMTWSLLNYGLVITALMLLLALIRNSREKHRFYMNIALRCAVFIILGVTFLLIYAQHGQPA